MPADAEAWLKVAVGGALLLGTAWLVWLGASLLVRHRWPATIPDELRFAREIASARATREVAEELAERFRPFATPTVVCLGPVRGNAARILFHAGPPNRGERVNLWRPDYLVEVVRRGKGQLRIELGLNRPYSYLRVRRDELVALRAALERAYGDLNGV